MHDLLLSVEFSARRVQAASVVLRVRLGRIAARWERQMTVPLTLLYAKARENLSWLQEKVA
jgi:hypothetical protein